MFGDFYSAVLFIPNYFQEDINAHWQAATTVNLSFQAAVDTESNSSALILISTASVNNSPLWLLFTAFERKFAN